MTNASTRSSGPLDSPVSGPVILFDGVCNLCHSSVRWVIRRDPKSVFKFASLQSDFAQKLLNSRTPAAKTIAGTGLSEPSGPANTNRPASDSVFLIDNNRIWEKSDAWLKIIQRLAPPWSWFGVFRIFPKGLRDAAYDFIAQNRYRWFGKKESCPLPDPKFQNRFLN